MCVQLRGMLTAGRPFFSVSPLDSCGYGQGCRKTSRRFFASKEYLRDSQQFRRCSYEGHSIRFSLSAGHFGLCPAARPAATPNTALQHPAYVPRGTSISATANAPRSGATAIAAIVHRAGSATEQGLNSEPALANTNVSVKTDESSVTLTGTVDTERQHDLAVRIAQSNAGGRKVVDKIKMESSLRPTWR